MDRNFASEARMRERRIEPESPTYYVLPTISEEGFTHSVRFKAPGMNSLVCGCPNENTAEMIAKSLNSGGDER